MYAWGDDTSGWLGPASYSYGDAGADARRDAARRSAASGGRTYDKKSSPIGPLVDPRKRIQSKSKNPLIIGVDVTGSMASWPFEIFDRLPLLYSTLAQYRPDLEVCFAAIGDARFDKWPLQATDFAHGYDLEQLLGSLYGEGGGGDAAEGYGLFAHWVDTHVETPEAENPFLIVFGDAPMHEKVFEEEIFGLLGDRVPGGVDAIASFQKVATRWNTWFLRRPTGQKGDPVDQQWFRAVGPQQVVHVHDEQRAIDYVLGIVARSWGNFEDFKKNMAARQAVDKVTELEQKLAHVKPRVLKCASCHAPLPPTAFGRWVCEYCKSTLDL